MGLQGFFTRQNLWDTFKKMLLCGVAALLIGVGVVFYLRCGYGVDPISVWVDGLSKALGIRYGTALLYHMLVLLGAGLVLARQNMGVGTVFIILVGGPAVNLVEGLLADSLPANGVYPTAYRVLMLAGGVLFLSLGLALQVSCRFGYNTNDVLLFKIVQLTGLQYHWVKVAGDWVFVLAGFLLGGAAGVGTVLSALLVGPLIRTFAKFYNHTILKVLHLQDERNEFQQAAA